MNDIDKITGELRTNYWN